MELNENIFDDLEEVIIIPQIDDNDISMVTDVNVETPELTLEDSAKSTVLIDLINQEWDLVNQLNSSIVSLQDLQCAEEIDLLNQIIADETTHIGKLQGILQISSPNVQNINNTETETDEMNNYQETDEELVFRSPDELTESIKLEEKRLVEKKIKRDHIADYNRRVHHTEDTLYENVNQLYNRALQETCVKYGCSLEKIQSELLKNNM